MLGRPGHPVFTRFATKAEESPPKPVAETETAKATADETSRKTASAPSRAA